MCSRIELFRSWKLEVGTPNKQFMVCIISSDFRMFLNEDYVLTVHGVDLTESVETFSHQAFIKTKCLNNSRNVMIHLRKNLILIKDREAIKNAVQLFGWSNILYLVSFRPAIVAR